MPNTLCAHAVFPDFSARALDSFRKRFYRALAAEPLRLGKHRFHHPIISIAVVAACRITTRKADQQRGARDYAEQYASLALFYKNLRFPVTVFHRRRLFETRISAKRKSTNYAAIQTYYYVIRFTPLFIKKIFLPIFGARRYIKRVCPKKKRLAHRTDIGYCIKIIVAYCKKRSNIVQVGHLMECSRNPRSTFEECLERRQTGKTPFYRLRK